MNGVIHRESDLNYDGPGPLGYRRQERPHMAIPVIHWLLDEHGRDCWRASCVCGFESPPYLEAHWAMVDAWEHQFPGGRISDLRRLCKTHDDTEAADNDDDISEETVSTNGHTPQPCPHCGRGIRPSNLPRHVQARHANVTSDRRIAKLVGCSPHTVNIRPGKLVSTGQLDKLNSTVGQDGKAPRQQGFAL